MTAHAYYNEFDPYAAQWLRNLISAGHIAPGEVDERSIIDVRADELRGFVQLWKNFAYLIYSAASVALVLASSVQVDLKP